jgi:transcriptional regulator with XRE-family HTH domain
VRFGQRVQILRERRGMTPAQPADLVTISPHTLKKVENGQQQAPGLETVMRIADAVTELSPNGGHSIKDRVEQNAVTASRTEDKVDQVAEQLAQHLRDHA